MSSRRSTIRLKSVKRNRKKGKDCIEKGQHSGHTVKIGLKNLKDKLFLLVNEVHTPIRNLSPAKHKIFHNCKEILDKILSLPPSEETKTAYSFIPEIFGNSKGPFLPGTVGSYFLGCITDTKYGGEKGCSATCAGMLQPPGDVVGWESCTFDVITFKDGDFVQQHMGITKDQVIIHVIDNNFDGFTSQNIETLKNAGYNKAALYIFNNDSSYTVEQDFVNLDQLPIRKKHTKRQRSIKSSEDANTFNVKGKTNRNDESEKSFLKWFWLLVIFIIVVILICVGVGFYRKKQSGYKY